MNTSIPVEHKYVYREIIEAASETKSDLIVLGPMDELDWLACSSAARRSESFIRRRVRCW
jgi:hypothetical protein